MNENEWHEVVRAIDSDIRGIIKAQRVLSDVHEELHRRAVSPIEEDFIFAEAFGRGTSEPTIKNIDGVRIEVRMLHRRGLRQADIKGADLLYEIAGHKFVLIQYKTAKDGRVSMDDVQLETLIATCPSHFSTRSEGSWSEGSWPSCGAWFAIVVGGEEKLYLTACKARHIFGDRASRPLDIFSVGLNSDVFEQLFARCWTGARVAPVQQSLLTWLALEHDRVLCTVLQHGSFGRW